MLHKPSLHKLVRRIPKGKVATYGQLAKLIGLPRHARHVGNALANTPENVIIPWHRVVNAQGRISLRRANWQSGSDDLQRILLESEGVIFDGSGRIRLGDYQWIPTGRAKAAQPQAPSPVAPHLVYRPILPGQR
ncbi:MAG: methylated-DNA--[protein]-cysteine S-methyltransferase [Rhodocyclaceae bacterium]|nr:methylated-DNA--[protein]-cysteine S-methyltransferase [Rhodocyclaceae bacterium]